MQRVASSIGLLSGWRLAAVAMLAGAVAVLGHAPFDFPLVYFIAFPVLVWLLDGASSPSSVRGLHRLKPAFVIGWWFGFGYFLAGLWWVGSAVLVDGDDYAWALPFAVMGLPAGLAFFFAFATALARLFWADGISRIFTLAFAFALVEWLREFVLTGFPWNPIGFAAMPIPLLMQSVAVVGVTGMNALAVLVFSMPALLSGTRHRGVGLALAAGLMAAHVGYGYVALNAADPEPGETIAVRIVQPNIDLTEKWDRAVRDRVFKMTVDLSTQPPTAGVEKPRVIVWPETSVPFFFEERPDALVQLGSVLDDDQMLLAGAMRMEKPGDLSNDYNAVVAIDGKGAIVDTVDKVHLVPFGEYLPLTALFKAIGIEQIVAGPMNLIAGSERHPIALPGGFSAVPYICYEIIFPRLMPSALPAKGFIVNVTNDAWFGNTPGPYQHLRQAQIRAVETGANIIRAANNGISASIDGKGRIINALAMGERGTIDAKIVVSNSERYVHYLGHDIGLAVVAFLALLGFLSACPLKLQ